MRLSRYGKIVGRKSPGCSGLPRGMIGPVGCGVRIWQARCWPICRASTRDPAAGAGQSAPWRARPGQVGQNLICIGLKHYCRSAAEAGMEPPAIAYCSL